MSILALLALSLTIFFETTQQLSFKHAHHVPGGKVLWTTIGAVLYVPQLLCWFFTLSLLPLAIAAPLLGASYVSVPLASSLIFKEKVTKRRWLGIVLIVAGLALISREMPT